jgi:hypothetical protein
LNDVRQPLAFNWFDQYVHVVRHHDPGVQAVARAVEMSPVLHDPLGNEWVAQ